MTQETNDVVGLIERLELSASESEMGRNLAGTPQTCRAAKARLQSQSARIAELRETLKLIASGEVGGDPQEPFSGYMRARKIALDSLTKDSTSGT